MIQLRLSHIFAPLSILAFLHACGREKKSKPAPAPPLGAVAQIFTDVAAKYRLPRDILLAIAFKESGLSPLASRGAYGTLGVTRGIAAGETVMGLARSTLKLVDTPDSDSLRVQVEAYGAWVRNNLDAIHLDLSPAINTPDAIYDWIWQLAKMHYSENQARKNVQILFALEIISTVNQGILWQDAKTLERIELPPRTPALSRSSFSGPIQANLQLNIQTSELFFVDYLQLTLGEGSKIENQPKRIMVIHCPYTLAICLGTQTVRAPTESVALGAHYVIPTDEGLFTRHTLTGSDRLLARPVKILQHRTPVRVTDINGDQQLITDAVVIMLVGNSGRYIDGSRTQTNPSWYTRTQLKSMGEVIQGVCQLMNRDDPSIDIDHCKTPGIGVEFLAPTGLGFRIGDIPDYDPSIFWAFAKNPDDLAGQVDLQLPANQKLFPAGMPIPLNLGFIRSTAKLEIQLLERCASGKTTWSTFQTLFIRNTDRKLIEINLYDKGPNMNGQHFLRALAYSSDGQLMGWAVKDLFLSNYDSAGTPGPSPELCLPSN